MNVTKIRRPADMERITTPKLAKAFIEEQVALIKEQVGDKKVLLALSGGVDSSVVAALLIKAIGQQLVCVHVNHGLLRKGEPEQVIEVFRNQMNANLVYVDATDRFLDKLAGVDDPEKKRKIIGGEFIEVFAEEARKLDGIEFLAQGTIYPDVVESGLGGESAVIKSHHNVGGLPDFVDFKEIIEPLRDLFKDEVRQAGLQLGIPERLVFRQPFPGPGLGIRIIGEVTEEKVKIVEDIFAEKISAEFVGLLRLIVEKGHFAKVDTVLDYFIDCVKEYKNIGTAYVTSAMELSEAQKAAVEKRLLETTKYVKFEMHYAVDSALIGGMVIRIGDRVVDSSVRTKLNDLTRELSKIQLKAGECAS